MPLTTSSRLGAYEIISPDAFMRPYIENYSSLASIYAVVARAYTKQVYGQGAVTSRYGRKPLGHAFQVKSPFQGVGRALAEEFKGLGLQWRRLGNLLKGWGGFFGFQPVSHTCSTG